MRASTRHLTDSSPWEGRTTRAQRVAVIFDNTVRPETTGVYCRRALGELVGAGLLMEVEHFRPDDLDRIPPGRFDLFLFVDDGLVTSIPENLRPAAWWAIDTHLGFERRLSVARQADWTCCAQRDGAEQMQAAGIDSATWLPLACDPELHGRVETPLRWDVAFVGHVFPGERQRLLELVQSRYPHTFVGNRYFEQMAETYSAAKCVFNRSIANDLNMRVFEGLCSGSLVVTNALDANGQSELFRDGVHLATYTSNDELLERLAYYLDHESERRRIAAAGRAEVVARHTYRRRMETLLAHVRQESLPPVSARCNGCTCGRSDGQCRSNSRACRNQPKRRNQHRLRNGVAQRNGAAGSVSSNGHAGSPHVRAAVESKEPLYFKFDRPDVLELVPTTVRRILDVGCGGGRLGGALKSRQTCEVVGIELNPLAAAHARERLDDVIRRNIETDDVAFDDGLFDCVICADVLEHLREPEVVLRKIRRWLSPGGCLVTSIPNVRHHAVVQSLLAGNWTYESAGLLDADHVRFFTRREIEKLLFRCGFEIDDLRMVPGDWFTEWVAAGRPRQVSVGGLQIRASSEDDAQEFFAYQWLTRAKPAAVPKNGLTSIILVTHNQLPYTKACLDSIRLRTDEPYELIIVDNGSTDGTVDYLQSLADVRLIANDTNRGFPAAVNQGLAVASGAQLLLLNNDTLVTTGWLRRLLDVLHSDPTIGLVGPVSNNVGSAQQIAIGYTQLAELDGWAWDWQRQVVAHSGPNTAQDTDRLVGFCLLIKRGVIEKIGVLDERFGIGCFEDDDLCRRALAAGYRAVIAPAAFVHHFGSATFRGSGIDLGDVLRRNQRLYEEKWAEEDSGIGIQDSGKPSDHLTQTLPGSTHYQLSSTHSPSVARPQYVLAQHPAGGLLLQPNAIRLSVCLIVRDNEHTIRPCLESIRPWVDEIVVVDTGSQDQTPAICEELGARVFHRPWPDSFAAARNVSLDHARGEWLLWMDSDDTIPEECGRKLRTLADGEHKEDVLGYVIQVHCPGDNPSDVTVVDHVKLIRNRPDIRFEFRIHEQILPAIRRAGGEVEFTDIYVVHSGSDRTQHGQARKLERDFRLLELELQDRPEHPFVLFNLGMTCADCGRNAEAIDYLERCLTVSQPEESHVRKAFALLVSALSRDGQTDAAIDSCEAGLRLYPDDKELLFRRAMLHHEVGELDAAAATYRRLLEEPTDRHFTSIDNGVAGFKARHNLALVYEDLGDPHLAIDEWKRVIADRPDFNEAWSGLGHAYLRLGDHESLAELMQSLSQLPSGRSTAALFRARLALQQGSAEAARVVLEQALRRDPRNRELLNERARLLFEHFDPAEACESLEALAEAEPDNASVLHNLGSAYQRAGRYAAATAALRNALRLRSDVAIRSQLMACTRLMSAEARGRVGPDMNGEPARPVVSHL